MPNFMNRSASTSTSGGTGVLTLTGAAPGYEALVDGTGIPYLLRAGNGTWEIGYGEVSAGAFSRTKPLAGDAEAFLPAIGTHVIYCVPLSQNVVAATYDPVNDLAVEIVPPYAGGSTSVVAGIKATTVGLDSVVVGYGATGSTWDVVVGSGASGYTATENIGCIAIGAFASATGENAIVIGTAATHDPDPYYCQAAENSLNIGGSFFNVPLPANTVNIGCAGKISSGQRSVSNMLYAYPNARRVQQEVYLYSASAASEQLPDIPMNSATGTFELSVVGSAAGGLYAVRIQGAVSAGAIVGTPVSTVLASTLGGVTVSIATVTDNLQITVAGAGSVDWCAAIDMHAFL